MTVVTGYFGNTAGNQALAVTLLQPGLYLAVHLTDPTALGDPSTELAGGDYIRQPIGFTLPSAKAVASTNGQTFTGLVAATVEWLAVWTAISAGAMVVALQLSPSLIVLDSGQIITTPGDVAWAL